MVTESSLEAKNCFKIIYIYIYRFDHKVKLRRPTQLARLGDMKATLIGKGSRTNTQIHTNTHTDKHTNTLHIDTKTNKHITNS